MQVLIYGGPDHTVVLRGTKMIHGREAYFEALFDTVDCWTVDTFQRQASAAIDEFVRQEAASQVVTRDLRMAVGEDPPVSLRECCHAHAPEIAQ